MSKCLDHRYLASNSTCGITPVLLCNLFTRVQGKILLQVGQILAVVRIGRALWGLGLLALHALVRALRRRMMHVATSLARRTNRNRLRLGCRWRVADRQAVRRLRMRLHLEGQANLAALQRDKLLANPRLGFVYELPRAIEL